MAKQPSVWVVAMINQEYLHNLFEDLLSKPEYKRIESYIPVVQVLKKQIRGKRFYQPVPLMLNYGFFKVPLYYISNPNHLYSFKKDIRCITSWLKDPIIAKKTYVRKNPENIAIALNREILRVKKQEENQTIYTKKDLATLYTGKIIVLQCYPFEGLPAEIKLIDYKNRKVQVKLLLETPLAQNSKILVDFENIFYTRYMEDYLDMGMKEESLEEINLRKVKKETYNDD